MTATRPYEAGAYHRDLPAELKRLHHFANMNWPKEARALQVLGLSDGMSVLEVGSGPGFYTELLSTLVPSGRVTGVEIDPSLIAHAQDYLAGRARCPFDLLEASVLDTGLPDGQFDFATARLVFQHIPDQVAALRELRRVLKPGGTLALIDVDYRAANLVYPVLDPIVDIIEKTAQLHALRGGDPHVGRRSWRLLERNGFDIVDMEAVALHSGEKGIRWAATQVDPDRLLPFVEKGLLSHEEVQAVRDAIDHVLTDPDSFYLSVMLIVAGRKPE